MKKTSLLGIALVAGTIGLAGCANQPRYESQYPSQRYPDQAYPAQGQYPSQEYPDQRYPAQGYASESDTVGTVDRIELLNRDDPNNIAGTVIGGVVGGLIGNQIGDGTGRSVATIAGVAGGAFLGNRIEQQQRASEASFRVTVRMDDGRYQTIDQDNVTDLRTGDRVRIDGNNIYRY